MDHVLEPGGGNDADVAALGEGGGAVLLGGDVVGDLAAVGGPGEGPSQARHQPPVDGVQRPQVRAQAHHLAGQDLQQGGVRGERGEIGLRKGFRRCDRGRMRTRCCCRIGNQMG